MTEKGLCLEEYTDYLKEFPFDGQHLAVDWGGERYEIWYCPGTSAYLRGLYRLREQRGRRRGDV